MQTVAEEKRKAYRCVVWCEEVVTQSQLSRLCQLTDLTAGRALEVN
jgi:tRNA U54 and U55 pseudouridine synthase Pus10